MFGNDTFWGYSSVGRAMRSQRIGQGFESPYLHFLLPTILIISIKKAALFYQVSTT